MPALHGITMHWLCLCEILQPDPPCRPPTSTPHFPSPHHHLSQTSLPLAPPISLFPTIQLPPLPQSPFSLSSDSPALHNMHTKAVCCAVHNVVPVGLISGCCCCLLCGWLLPGRCSGEHQPQLAFTFDCVKGLLFRVYALKQP